MSYGSFQDPYRIDSIEDNEATALLQNQNQPQSLFSDIRKSAGQIRFTKKRIIFAVLIVSLVLGIFVLSGYSLNVKSSDSSSSAIENSYSDADVDSSDSFVDTSDSSVDGVVDDDSVDAGIEESEDGSTDENIDKSIDESVDESTDETADASVDESEDAAVSTDDGVSFTASNEYGIFENTNYPWMDDLSLLAEPYKTTVFEVNNIESVSDQSDSFTYSWRLVGNDGTTSFEANTDTPQWTVVIKDVGPYVMDFEAKGTKGNIKYTASREVYAKYVKRELRSLTDEDRERFLSAAKVLYEVDTDTGREKYGDMYTSIDTFTEMHALASNDIRCDEYHDGSGFITHHLALQMSFEEALRSVDPAVVLPYWDFSIEGQEIQEAGEDPSYFLEITPFLNDEWFGTTDPDTGRVIDSKFAHINMPIASKDSMVKPNSYGIIRSPWNNNNDIEVTRHLFDVCGVQPIKKPIPSCSTHYDLLSVDSLADFQVNSPGLGHGPMHVNSGGVYGGCVEAWAKFVEDHYDELMRKPTEFELSTKHYKYDQVYKYSDDAPLFGIIENVVIAEYYHIYRSLWRSHMCSRDSTYMLLKCPESCDMDTPAEECKCTVPGLADGTADWEDVFECLVEDDGKKEMIKNFLSKDLLEDLTIMVGTTQVSEGEMLESASPADILFWMIHPAIDRMLMAKRLPAVTQMGSQSFENWGEDDEVWYEYSKYTQGEGDNPTFPDAYTCLGHGQNDPVLAAGLPLSKHFVNMADTNGDNILSNWEFYTGIDPRNPLGVDYVFDHFNWDHCGSFYDVETD